MNTQNGKVMPSDLQTKSANQSAKIAPKVRAPLIWPSEQSTGGCCEGCRQEAAAKSATKASIASAGSTNAETGNNIHVKANFTTPSASIAQGSQNHLIGATVQGTGDCCEGCREKEAATIAKEARIAPGGSTNGGTTTNSSNSFAQGMSTPTKTFIPQASNDPDLQDLLELNSQLFTTSGDSPNAGTTANSSNSFANENSTSTITSPEQANTTSENRQKGCCTVS